MWLCYNAALPEQDQCYEAVGAALDKELSVWRPVEKDPQLFGMRLFRSAIIPSDRFFQNSDNRRYLYGPWPSPKCYASPSVSVSNLIGGNLPSALP